MGGRCFRDSEIMVSVSKNELLVEENFQPNQPNSKSAGLGPELDNISQCKINEHYQIFKFNNFR